MSPRSFPCRLLALCALLILTSAVAGQTGTKKAPVKKAVPKGLSPAAAAYLDRLHSWFYKYASKEGSIDKQGLATAFGYRTPYDAKPGTKGKKEDDAEVAAEPESEGLKMLKGAPPWARRPDYQFMMKVDTSKDEEISLDEFDVWAIVYAKEYAEAIEEAQEMQERLVDMQRRALQIYAQQAQRAHQQQMARLRTQQAQAQARLRDRMRQQDRSFYNRNRRR